MNKYYIESGNWRVEVFGENFLVALNKSLKFLIDNAEVTIARLSGAISVSRKGYILDLFDDDLKSILTVEEIANRQEDYIIISEVKPVMADPDEDIIFLPTEQVLRQLGYHGEGDDSWSGTDLTELNVR